MKKAIVLCILGMAAAAPVCGFTLAGKYNGTTNYVSKSGSDANDGKSWATAKKTIQAAVDLCADGDTVVVDDGEYSDTTRSASTSSRATARPRRTSSASWRTPPRASPTTARRTAASTSPTSRTS